MKTDGKQPSTHLPLNNIARRRWAHSQLKRKASSRVKNLAASPANGRVVVDEIVFSSVKRFCSDLGIQEGTRLVCRGNRELDEIVVEDEGGSQFHLPRDYALFVWVRET